jgi:hypothetical protein
VESEGILSGIRVGRNFRRSRKEFLESESEGIFGAVGVGRNFKRNQSRKEF